MSISDNIMLEKVFKSDIKVRNDLEFLHELAEFHESVDGAHIELDGLSQLLIELDEDQLTHSFT